MTSKTFLPRRLHGIAAHAAAMWQTLRASRHRIRLADLRDLSYGDDGSLVSTGFHPQADLISDRAQPPQRWCWVAFTAAGQGDAAAVPRLLVHQQGSPMIERFLLAPISRDATALLLRLPDRVSRIRLVPGNRPGRTNIRSVQIVETGKLRLLATLVLKGPRLAWRIYRTTPSFTHFKTKLIEAQQERQLPTDGPHWLHIYASGVHPLAIRYDDRTSVTFAVVLNAAGSDALRLEAAMASVRAQTYPRWRLMVGGAADPASLEALQQAMARSPAISILDGNAPVPASMLIGREKAEFILFMNAATLLEPHALARFAAAAVGEAADMLYGDGLLVEDDGLGYIALNALPVFSHESYLRSPAQFGPIALRGSSLPPMDGRDEPAFPNETAVLLRALERPLRIVHIADILSRSLASYRMVSRDGASAVAAHLRHLGYPEAEVTSDAKADAFAIRRHARHDARILAVVPTKNRRVLLETCIASVRATTGKDQIDIAVVDHESTEADTLRYLDDVSLTGVRILRHEGPFNYSALNNAAISRFGDGYDFYLFLNNDIEAEQEGWLDAMLDLALQPDVGVVGATLLYPDRRIQHAGVVAGMVGAAEHAYRFARLDDYLNLRQGPHLTREYSAVTGACMLVSSAAFASVGGFDEQLAVGFNDIDLCLRIGATGHRVLQCAEAVLIHHESVSRGKAHDGRDLHPADTRFFYARHARILAQGDPFFSPLLDPRDPLFVPRPFLLREDSPKLRAITYVPVTKPAERVQQASR